MKSKLLSRALIIWSFAPAAAFASTPPGTLNYNTTHHRYEFYDGSAWYDFSLGLPLGLARRKA